VINKWYTKYIQQAININKDRDDFRRGQRVVAMFFNNKTLILTSMNSTKTHPRMKIKPYSKNVKTQHAEFRGINYLDKRNLKANSVVIVRGIGGLPSLPCKACMKLLIKFGIKRIITEKNILIINKIGK